METIIGLMMMASWVWSIIIISKKTENTTQNEKIALFVALVSFVFYFLGTV